MPLSRNALIDSHIVAKEPHITTLPYNVLFRIFDFLSVLPETASSKNRHLVPLLHSSSFFINLYRTRYARTLSFAKLRHPATTVHDPPSHADLIWALSRLPLVKSLDLTSCFRLWDGHLGQAFANVDWGSAGPDRIMALTLKRVDLRDEDFDAFKYFPNLKVLDLAGCRNVTPRNLMVITSAMPLLENLSFHIYPDAMQPDLCEPLVALRKTLRSLRMVFKATGAMSQIHAHLRKLDCLQCLDIDGATSITDSQLAEICGALNSSGNLETLVLSSFNSLTPAAANFIPSSIQELHVANCTDLMDDASAKNLFSMLPRLSRLRIRGCCPGLTSLDCPKHLLAQITSLEIGGLFRGGHPNLDPGPDIVKEMQKLQVLKLHGSCVSLETVHEALRLGCVRLVSVYNSERLRRISVPDLTTLFSSLAESRSLERIILPLPVCPVNSNAIRCIPKFSKLVRYGPNELTTDKICAFPSFLYIDRSNP